MKLGFYTNYDEKTVAFAHKVGFRSMELSAWPDSSLNADKVTDRRIKEVKKDLKEHDMEVSALGYYPNFLDPHKENAEEATRYSTRYWSSPAGWMWMWSAHSRGAAPRSR